MTDPKPPTGCPACAAGVWMPNCTHFEPEPVPAPTYLDPVRDELDRLRTEVTHWRELADNRLTERQWALRDHARAQAALEQAEARVDQLTDTLTLRSDALNRTGASNDTLRATLTHLARTLLMQAERTNDIATKSALIALSRHADAPLLAALADQEPARD